jgi:hypothetical protein
MKEALFAGREYMTDGLSVGREYMTDALSVGSVRLPLQPTTPH